MFYYVVKVSAMSLVRLMKRKTRTFLLSFLASACVQSSRCIQSGQSSRWSGGRS